LGCLCYGFVVVVFEFCVDGFCNYVCEGEKFLFEMLLFDWVNLFIFMVIEIVVFVVGL